MGSASMCSGLSSARIDGHRHGLETLKNGTGPSGCQKERRTCCDHDVVHAENGSRADTYVNTDGLGRRDAERAPPVCGSGKQGSRRRGGKRELVRAGARERGGQGSEERGEDSRPAREGVQGEHDTGRDGLEGNKFGNALVTPFFQVRTSSSSSDSEDFG